jgi:hypothetical protein
MRLIIKAREEEKKERLYRWWLVRYPYYTEANYETFEDFCQKFQPIEIDQRSKDEIMREILEIGK